MAVVVTKIPATKKPFTSMPIDMPVRRKVAGYARVSTDHEEQLSSYEAQLAYYTDYIQKHQDWEFVGMYADEGISGTGIKKRKGFQSMVDDALAGKIDLIVTKSVSRFARNTVDSLTTIRKLKEHGIEVYFEKENIYTLDSKGEFLITLMSSLSQEESRSISENTTWGLRQRFAAGKASIPYSRFLGYDKGPNDSWIINEEQAETVKEIYKLFLQGLSYAGIARQLIKEERTGATGRVTWPVNTIKNILTNEKYKGDALLQKSFTTDFLTKKMKVNEGEVPQFYVKEHHPAIIDPDTFDLVQAEMLRRSRTGKRYSAVNIFSSKIVCGDCGNYYGRKIWHSNDAYRKVVWRCNYKYREHHIKKGNGCRTPTLSEDEIKEAFVKAMNKYIGNKDEIIGNFEAAQKMLNNTSKLEKQKQKYADEMNEITEEYKKAVSENARHALDQKEYKKKYDELEQQYKKAEESFNEVTMKIAIQQSRDRQLTQMIKELKKADDVLTEFDPNLWGVFVDRMTVFKNGKKIIKFKDGTEVTV